MKTLDATTVFSDAQLLLYTIESRHHQWNLVACGIKLQCLMDLPEGAYLTLRVPEISSVFL